MAAVPSIGRANRIEGAEAPEADLTRALYEQYANQIFRYCLHQLGSREEAEDAVQSTFLNAFRGIRRGIVPELESAWLFKIAHNVCLSRRRSTWRRGRVEAPTDFEVVEELAPAPSRRAEELIGLQDVLQQMPEQQRRAILLREWQGLSYREIAEELDLSQAAVETLIFRARRSLAQGLEQPLPAYERRRARRAAGALGGLLSAAQGWLLGGGAAVKVAATVAVVGAGTAVATAPMPKHAPVHKPSKPASSALQHARAPVQVRRTSGVGVVPPVSVARRRVKHAVHVQAGRPAPPVTPTADAPVSDPPPAAEAPVAPAPASQRTPAPAPAAQPATRHVPPGQAKKTTTEQTRSALPPGQAKKSAPVPPVAGAPAALPPGQAKKSEVAPPTPVVTTTTPVDAAASLPPGQARKIESLPPAADAPLTTTAVTTPEPEVPAPVDTPQAGSDTGKARGKEK